MKAAALSAFVAALLLTGCGAVRETAPAVTSISSVTPSVTGTPNAVATLGSYIFVSVQGTGQIFTYNIASGTEVQAGAPYAMPCSAPSGMVIANINGANVLAVVCYDTGALVTLTINANGSLSALGSVSGLGVPFPGTALDGTNVLVPVFGQYTISTGGVAKVSIANPAVPVVTGTVTLAAPVPGGVANPAFLAVSNGKIYVVAGSESAPQATSSTIQVVDEATMTLVGTPLAVAHSPQQIAIAGTVAFATVYDATELVSIDISNPASLKVFETLAFAATNANCRAIPIALQASVAYVGCYDEGNVQVLLVSNPTDMRLLGTIPGVANAQRLAFDGDLLLAPGSATGGAVYVIQPGLFGAE